MLWAARLIAQRLRPAAPVTLQPLVAGLAADAKPPTQLLERDRAMRRENNELMTLGHGSNRAPGHPSVLPMSPNACHPCLRSIQSHRAVAHRARFALPGTFNLRPAAARTAPATLLHRAPSVWHP